ncbi:PQQ-binding-like beta-propeller repeat protein, partial [Marinobacter sp. CHS3-4]|uniref:outer membrane protein assembly factor BamB family protein n=1 Tax=Marinobacter sp. CHS3-4 TaxID=3045174 RepID=UPI0024B5AFD8
MAFCLLTRMLTEVKDFTASIPITFFAVFLFLASATSANTLVQELKVGQNIGSSVAFGTDGERYVGSADGNLYGISPDLQTWTFPSGAQIAATPVAGAQGEIIVASTDGSLFSLDASTRSQRWVVDTGYPVYSSPALSATGTIYVGSRAGILSAVSSESGEIIWRVSVDSEIGGSPVVGPRGDIYVGTRKGSLYRIGRVSGDVVFQHSAGESVSSPAFDRQGNIYFGTYGGLVRSVDRNGNLRWQADVGEKVASSPVLNESGKVYVVSHENGVVFSLDQSGGQQYSLDLGESVYSSPAITPAGDIVIATISGSLFLLSDSADQLVIKSQQQFDSGFYSSISINSDGFASLVTTEGALVSGILPESTVAGTEDGPWPMFGFNAQQVRTQIDSDADNCADFIDAFPNDPEFCLDTDNDGEADVLDSDSDGDGMPDSFELANGLDPAIDDAASDFDGDGYSNQYEFSNAYDPSFNQFDDQAMARVEAHDVLEGDGPIAISRDGRYLAIAAGSHIILYLRDIETGKLTWLDQTRANTDAGSFFSIDLEFIGDNLYLFGVLEPTYFQNPDLHAIYQFSVGSGEVELQKTVPLAELESGAEMEPGVAYRGSDRNGSIQSDSEGKYLYLGVRGRGVLIFDRDDTTGDFTFREHFLNGESYLHAHTQLVMSDSG